MGTISRLTPFEVCETLNYLYEVRNRLTGDYSHIEHAVSKRFRSELDRQIEKLTEIENKMRDGK
jgi:uncharacterized protein YutE (UPF0331/DUF86 family)